MKPALTILVAVALWFLLTSRPIVSPLYLPSPSDAIKALRPQMLTGLLATVVRTATGFLLGVVLAYLFHFAAIAMGTEVFSDQQFAASRSIPAIALLPLFVLWFGFSETGRIIIVASAASLYYIAPLHEAYRRMPREWQLLREKLRLSVPEHYVKVVVPGTIVHLTGALRLSLSIGFTMAIASEYLGAQTGLGKVIDSARVTFNVPGLFATIIIAAISGLAMDRIVVGLSRLVIHWPATATKG